MDALEFPIRVSEMAEDQAYHIQQIVDEAQTAETRREREAKDCPENRMSFLVSRHNREREFEVLKIKRMREEHAMLLGNAMHDELPEYVQGGRESRTTSNKRNVGTTNQELAFLKDIYGKVEGSRDLLQQKRARDAAAVMRQRSSSSRLSLSSARSHGFGPLPSNRGSLLNEKKDLLLRLHALVTVEENMALYPTARLSCNDLKHGFSQPLSASSRGRGSGEILTARSTASSQASGATFCPANATKHFVFPVPKAVPRLRLQN